MASDKKPFHEVVAERLIEQLKAGTAPWQKPWEPGSQGFLPMNPTTGKRYKGINVIHLMSQGRSDNRWLTYNQAKAEGAQVRKGEKGTAVQYWKFSEEQTKLDEKGKPVLDAKGKPVKETVMLERPRVFFATVFNGEQVDGLPPLEQKEQTQRWDAIERAEKILKASGAVIRHGEHDRAFYRPSTDSIHLPNKEQFPTADNYYATALHELGHWTGHSSRLDRDISHPFGSQAYAKEELRAECTSLILGDELGIGHDPEQHAAYVGSWIKALQEDPLEIFRATSDAEKISNYVLAFEQVQEQEQSQVQSQQLEVTPEKEQETGMQLPSTNQSIREKLLAELPEDEAQALVTVADARKQYLAGETDATVFKDIAKEQLGFDLPADWNGNVQVQGNVLIEVNGQQFVEPADDSAPEFWGVYAQREDGLHQWVADIQSASLAEEFSNRLSFIDALSEGNEFEQTAKLARVNEVKTRLNPDSTADEILAAKEDRKTAETAATLNNSEIQQLISEYEKKPQTAPVPEPTKERTYINVPYKQKNEAKELGARWDRQQQSWFVPPGVDVAPFAKWNQTPEQRAPEQPQQQEKAPQSTQQTQYLAVPYGERGAAKAAGAMWDKSAKSWYVGPNGDMERLNRWLPDNVQTQQSPAMSPKEEFAEAMRSLGCEVNGEHPIMDGKKHRIRTEGDKKGVTHSSGSGFYVGHLDGHPAGFILNNRTGVEMKWKSKGYSLDPEEKAKLQAEAAAKLEARAAELEQSQERTAQRVSKQLDSLVPATEATAYMTNKGIKPLLGVLTDAEGKKTYIPASDENGKVWTMQYIQEDGTKRFAKDSKKEGCFHVVGGNLDSLETVPALVIQEGYATAATNAEALGFPTVAAFDSGNLENVAKVLHNKFPDKPVVILGDNDRHQELTQGTNPGKTKAEAAAKAVGGKADFPIFAPGEADYPANLDPVTPQKYRDHLRASKELETAPDDRKAVLQSKLLTNDQLAALDNMKRHTDFNDLAMNSSLGRDAVERQVRTTVGKAIRDAEHKQEHKHVEQQTHKQKRSARIGY